LAYWEYYLATKEFILNDQYYELHRTDSEQVGGYRIKTDDFFRTLVQAEDVPAFAAYILQVPQVAGAAVPGQSEIRIRCADGATRWVLVNRSAQHGKSSDAVKLMGTIQDITDRKLAQDALRATQSDLARVAQLTTMGQMAASIAHDRNRPGGA
jgi:hypothetical protein